MYKDKYEKSNYLSVEFEKKALSMLKRVYVKGFYDLGDIIIEKNLDPNSLSNSIKQGRLYILVSLCYFCSNFLLIYYLFFLY